MSLEFRVNLFKFGARGGSRISGKRVHIYKGVGFHFPDFISFSLKFPMEIK